MFITSVSIQFHFLKRDNHDDEASYFPRFIYNNIFTLIIINVKLPACAWFWSKRLNHQFSRYYGKMNTENQDFQKLCKCQSLHCVSDIFRDNFRSLFLTLEKEDNIWKTIYYFRLVLCDDLFQVILMCSEKETWQ